MTAAGPASGPPASHATLHLDVGNARAVAALAAALAPDQEGFATARIEGGRLVVEADAASPMGLLRTLDDVLASVRGAAAAEPRHGSR